MADLRSILADPNYVNANPATKRAIFDKRVATDPAYAQANPATQSAIRKKFGLDEAATAAPAIEKPATPAETFGEGVLGGAASTADLLAGAAVGAGQWLTYPFRRAAGGLTGETAESINASQERVAGATSTPVGDILGVTNKPSYQNNMIRQAMNYVGGTMDAVATETSKSTGIPKSDVLNMMQSVMAVAPVKVPGAKTAGRVVTNVAKRVGDVVDPRTAFYMDIAEGRGPQLVAAARSPSAEIIPGAPVTFAQATSGEALPRLAAVGEQAKALQPTAAQAIKDAQEAARVGQLTTIERTPARRALAEEVRSRRAGALYEEAKNAGSNVNVAPVDISHVIVSIDDLIKENPGNAPLLAEMRRLRKGLTEPGVDAQGNPIRVPRTDAQEVMSTIDGLKSSLAKEDNRFIKSQLTGIKKDLTDAVPFLPEAEAAFKKGSRPINQMDIATYLREKLQSPVPEAGQRAASFANAVREAPRTVKQALDGAPPYQTFTEAGLSKTQQRMIDDVVIDLSRDARVKELAQAGREAAPTLKKTPGTVSLPPFLNTVVTVANEILRRVSGKITQKMAMDIAMEFLDANRAASALETAMQRTGRRQAIGAAVTAPVRAVRAAGPGIRASAVTAPNQMSPQNRNALAR